MNITQRGYVVAHNADFVTRPEWGNWWIPLPTNMSDAEITEYLHDCQNEMNNFILSLQAVNTMVKHEVKQ